MILKSAPNKQKAKSLKKMAEITLDRLHKTSLQDYPSNALTDYYDIIHKLLESLASLGGVKISGEGAHQELIDYICKKHNLGESTRIFLQEMREFRNRISYEGFSITSNYISLNKDKIESIIKTLLTLVVL